MRAERRQLQDVSVLRVKVSRLEFALWQGGFSHDRLAALQAAYRELEQLLAKTGESRHTILILIPVADSPVQLATCLDSLLALCEAFGYGGVEDGRYRRVAVLIADDSAREENRSRHREIAARIDAAGLRVDYFGIAQQLALLDRLSAESLRNVIGSHPRDAFGRKGQAMMRNLSYLRAAEIQQADPGRGPWLLYTVDADQRFSVEVPGSAGVERVCALNYLYEIDRLFSTSDVQVVTGKVVGDPPVSPAVMTAGLLEDLTLFLHEMAAAQPRQRYPQPVVDARGAGEAAYHDMPDLFGFAPQAQAYRYRCRSAAATCADCFVELAARVQGFLHGEHPTRVSWYRYQAVDASLQSARTVYTGNYVFRAEALRYFIPFATLRLRMSGPTMGRLLQAELGARFVSVNLPMLHLRTLQETHRAEFRPGVKVAEDSVDLADEMQRQFFGDVMLFSMQRLIAAGYPHCQLSAQYTGEVLDLIYAEMHERYRLEQDLVQRRLEQFGALLRKPKGWWHAHAPAATCNLERFMAAVETNFGGASPLLNGLANAQLWEVWRSRLCAALLGFGDDRRLWDAALQRLREGRC